MSLYERYDMQYCDRCHAPRPHSKRGNCLATHRSTQLATVTPMKRTPLKSVSPTKTAVKPSEQNDCGCTTLCQTGCILFGPCPPQAPKPHLVRPVKKAAPRRTFDQVKVAAAINSLLTGVATLQQAARDADVDTEYLHRRAWKAAKDTVNKRDDGACQYPGCTTTGWVKDTQHRIGRGTGGSSNPLVAYYLPNLITLCRAHHTHVTAYPLVGQSLGLVIPRLPPVDPATIPTQTTHGLVLLHPDGERTIIQPPDQEAS